MPSVYETIIVTLFLSKYQEGVVEIPFSRQEIIDTAISLGLERPKNIGDLIYSFKFRANTPQQIIDKAPEGLSWRIKNTGSGQYQFILSPIFNIEPDEILINTKIPESTPSVVKKYALSDEQSLLAIVRYNRLVDIFLGAACYSLQNHLRTQVQGIGQIETDELYIGVDKSGCQYIIPVEAKGGNDRLGLNQIEQDIEMCTQKFSDLICRCVACQFMEENVVALFEFQKVNGSIVKVQEKHYMIVDAEDITREELSTYSR